MLKGSESGSVRTRLKKKADREARGSRAQGPLHHHQGSPLCRTAAVLLIHGWDRGSELWNRVLFLREELTVVYLNHLGDIF